MCNICCEIVKKIQAKGYSEEDAMGFLWNNTPFPVSHPTKKNFQELESIPDKSDKPASV